MKFSVGLTQVLVLVILNLGGICGLHITPPNATEDARKETNDENGRHVDIATNKAMDQTQIDNQQQMMSQMMLQNQMIPQNQPMISQNSIYQDQMMENSQPQQTYQEPNYRLNYIDDIRPIKYQIPTRPSYVDYPRPFGSQYESYNSDHDQSYKSSGYRTASGYGLYPGQGQTYRYESVGLQGRKQQEDNQNYESLKYFNTRYPNSRASHRHINSVPHPDSYKTPSYQQQKPTYPSHGYTRDIQHTNDYTHDIQHTNDYTHDIQHTNESYEYESLKYYSLDTCEYRFILDMVQCQESHDVTTTTTQTQSHVQHGGPSGTPTWADQSRGHNDKSRGHNQKEEQKHSDFDIPNTNHHTHHGSHRDNQPGFVPSFGHPFYAPGLDRQWFSRFYSSFRAGTVRTHEQTQSRMYYRYGDFAGAATDFRRMRLAEVKSMTSSVQVSSQTTIDGNWSGVSPLFNYRVYLLDNGCTAHGYTGSHPCIVFKGATHPYKEVSRVFIYVKQTTEVKVEAERERQTVGRGWGRK